MLVFFAKWFALFAHATVGHRRKYTGEFYGVHLAEVAGIVASVGGSKAQIAAAWLHDTVEDTWVTQRLIVFLFGAEVGQLVYGLTDISKASDGNRKVRKALDAMHNGRQSPECKTVKLADGISNLVSVMTHDPRFAKVYVAEKKALLPLLVEGDATLWQRVSQLIETFEKNSQKQTVV